MSPDTIDISRLPPEVRANMRLHMPSTETTTESSMVTNADFLAALSPALEPDERLWCCHFATPPNKATAAQWSGFPLVRPAPDTRDRNAYFSVATLRPDTNGEHHRRKENFGRLMCVVLDDPTTLQGEIPPTWILETSHNKVQVGYRLTDPVADLGVARRLHSALADAGHLGADQNGNNPLRYVRLPIGSNTKHDPPHPHRLIHWAPEVSVSLESLIAGLGLDAGAILNPPLEPPRAAAEPTTTDPTVWSIRAERIAMDAALRTITDPKLGRHAEIFALGCRAARDGLPFESLETALQTFAARMRPCDTNGVVSGINWEAERQAIQDGYIRGRADGIPAPADFTGLMDKAQTTGNEQATGSATPWSEPEPLRAPVPPPEPYPVEALGEVLGPAVWALHEAIKAPVAMCAQSVLAAASFAAQAHFDAAMPWGEVKPVSLAMLTVGESGERKSGVDDLVLGAAKAQERADMSAYEDDRLDYESELAQWKRALEAANKRASGKDQGRKEDYRKAADDVGPPPQAPILPLRFVSDPTVEGLYKLLAISQPSVALFSDEGGLLIGGHALNSDNALKTLARWCKMWDGSPYDRVRGGDGSGILYGRRMALHQLAQPDVMTSLLSDRMANGQGFLARCLVAWPESTIGTRIIERYERGGDRQDVKRLFARLKSLFEAPPRTMENRAQELDPRPLALAADAEPLAVAASNQFESLMRSGMPLCEIRDRASKAMDNAMRIAVTLTAIDRGLAAHEISRETFERALVLVQWYLAEALRIRGTVAVSQSVVDAESLLDWLRSRGLRLFRSHQVLNSGPAQLRNKTRFTTAVAELVSNGYVAPNPPGTVIDGVKTRMSWQVNPDVL
ncbi:MAG: DUF3987 domain-containing protein [Gammaproteobacteria bacterium]|nr:DUF3987 domain-containing protein [Gammaproteobacteria bacterium]